MNNNEVKPGERVVEGKEQTSTAAATGMTSGQQVGHLRGEVPASIENLDKITLHEERARVDVVREQAGAVSIRKVLVERTETIPVTLTREVLEITVKAGTGKVLLDGKVLEPGQTYEVLVQDERAMVQKEIYAVSDVTLHKQVQQTTHTEQVTLRREELEVSDPQGLVREIDEVATRKG